MAAEFRAHIAQLAEGVTQMAEGVTQMADAVGALWAEPGSPAESKRSESKRSDPEAPVPEAPVPEAPVPHGVKMGLHPRRAVSADSLGQRTLPDPTNDGFYAQMYLFASCDCFGGGVQLRVFGALERAQEHLSRASKPGGRLFCFDSAGARSLPGCLEREISLSRCAEDALKFPVFAVAARAAYGGASETLRLFTDVELAGSYADAAELASRIPHNVYRFASAGAPPTIVPLREVEQRA